MYSIVRGKCVQVCEENVLEPDLKITEVANVAVWNAGPFKHTQQGERKLELVSGSEAIDYQIM